MPAAVEIALLLRGGRHPKRKSAARGRWGDEPAVSPATRRRLVAFQTGSDPSLREVA
jgi:hypothetical protein